jgi:hypothetical protein
MVLGLLTQAELLPWLPRLLCSHLWHLLHLLKYILCARLTALSVVNNLSCITRSHLQWKIVL